MDWERIWHDHWQEVYQYIYFKVNGRQEAEDLTQETFIRLIRSGKGFDDAPIIALLKKTAARLIIDRWRKNKNHSHTLSLTDFDYAIGDDGQNNPESQFIRNESIRQAMDLLTEDQRMIVRLRLIQGYSVKDTAELSGKSETSVRTLQFRAIQTIKQKLGATGEEGDETR
jgi:RNA polymerase sigma-70 factor, ECF subfamily